MSTKFSQKFKFCRFNFRFELNAAQMKEKQPNEQANEETQHDETNRNDNSPKSDALSKFYVLSF